jgi:hypothetical protein
VEVLDNPTFSYWNLHGSHEVVSLPSPAAGAALTVTVPGAVQWEVVAVSFLLTASANAATRIPFISFLDPSGAIFCKINTVATVTATNTPQVTFAEHVAAFGANNGSSIGNTLPRMRIQDGLRVQISADAIDVADTITKARLYVRQFEVRPDYT